MVLQKREVIPTKRSNCDKYTNQMGNKLIDFCKGHDLQILNGRTIGDQTGSFTFYDTQQGASTIDVAVVSDSLQPVIKSLVVQHQSEMSKHCKIVVRIKNLKESSALKKSKDEYPWISTPKKYIWEEDSQDRLYRALNSPELASVREELTQYLDAGLVDQASNKLDELYTKAADTVLKVRKKAKQGKHPYKHKQKPKKWYNSECRSLKDICRKLAIQKRKDPTDTQTRQRHAMALKEYKQMCTRKKFEFEQNQIKELDHMLSEDHSEFWKKWKTYGDSLDKRKTPNVDGHRWEKYFRKLYDDNTSPSTLSPIGTTN